MAFNLSPEPAKAAIGKRVTVVDCRLFRWPARDSLQRRRTRLLHLRQEAPGRPLLHDSQAVPTGRSRHRRELEAQRYREGQLNS